LRVLVVSGEYPPIKGGVGRYTYHLVRALREKKNIDIHVAVDGGQSKTRATTATAMTTVVKSPSMTIKNTTNSDIGRRNIDDNDDVVYYDVIKKGDWKNSHRLSHLVEELNPDIVNIQYERGLYEVDTTMSHIVKRVIYGSTLDKFYKKCPISIVSTLQYSTAI
jgi:glycosyltransferase involved in cell wall biosynthesis